jgi:hypothetical protein
VRRDRRAVGYSPTAWFNDVGGLTLGLRQRDNYMGRFELVDILASVGTGWESEPALEDHGVNWMVRLRNPVWLRSTGMSQTFEGFNAEGRYGARIEVERTHREHLSFGAVRREAISLRWVGIDDERYLDPRYYEPVNTVELALAPSVATRSGRWAFSLESSLAGGVAYAREGLEAATGRPEVDPFYGRFLVQGIARRPLGGSMTVAARLFAGTNLGEDATVKQRQIYLAGADPYQQLNNPFLRSVGSLFTRDDIYYHAPGGAGIRGLDPRLSTMAAVALNVELERTLRSRPRGGLFNRVALAAFGDAGHTIDDGTIARAEGEIRFVADAGLGLRAEHRIGTLRFATRADFPLWVSRAELAQDRDPSDDAGFRWTFSFAPAF